MYMSRIKKKKKWLTETGAGVQDVKAYYLSTRKKHEGLFALEKYCVENKGEICTRLFNIRMQLKSNVQYNESV